jgi:hypothetical protein
LKIRIFYYCGANAQPTGGNKIIYRHVDLLAQVGLDAWVYHPVDDFVYSGLVRSPRVVSPSTIEARRCDVFVLPEDGGPGMSNFAPGMRKLIFNQNAYYTFRHFGLGADALPPYDHPDVMGALVVSEDSRRYLDYAFSGLACERLVLSLNFEAFAYMPWSQKRRQIAYMTRKNADDVAQVVKVLSRRGLLRDWVMVPIEGLSEPEVARIMGESMLFLAFGHPEGLSLANLEALACGCRLIGYSGRAGREYFEATGSQEIEVGDVVGFCQAVEAFVLGAEDADAAASLAVEALKASRFVRETYSAQRERDSLLAAMGQFLNPLQASP